MIKAFVISAVLFAVGNVFAQEELIHCLPDCGAPVAKHRNDASHREAPGSRAHSAAAPHSKMARAKRPAAANDITYITKSDNNGVDAKGFAHAQLNSLR